MSNEKTRVKHFMQNDTKRKGVARRRGRPRKFDEAEALVSARDAFWNGGYAGTSLDNLAVATGLSRPSLYAAFGDKHALYLRALQENRMWSVAGISQRLNGGAPLRQALLDFFIEAAASTLAGEMGPRGCFIVCTAVTESLRDADVREIAARYFADVDRVFLERFLRSPDELNDRVDPATAAAVASAMLQTLALRARTGSERADLVGIAHAAVSVICGAP